MITFDSVSKKFANKKILDNVSFKVNYGEIIGFLGLNGAGKTTTMRLITGHLAPTSGVVAVDGLSPIDDRIAVVSKIGYLPENNPLYLDMKVSEYLNFVKRIKFAEDDIAKIVLAVGLDSYYNTKIENLSRGYRQRVGLAVALIGNPPILILDEPTSGLDPVEQDKMRELIKRIAEKKIVIFSTHILSEVEDIANRIIILHDRKIAYDGSKPKGKGEIDKLFRKVVS